MRDRALTQETRPDYYLHNLPIEYINLSTMDSNHLLISDTLMIEEFGDFLPLVTLKLQNRAILFVHDDTTVTIQRLRRK